MIYYTTFPVLSTPFFIFFEDTFFYFFEDTGNRVLRVLDGGGIQLKLEPWLKGEC